MATHVIFKKWCDHPGFSETERGILGQYTEEEINTFFSHKPYSFGTAGIRRTVGLSPQQWNIYTYRLVAVGFAKCIKETGDNLSVLIAHDNRPNGDVYALAVAKVLRDQGLTVYLAPNNESMPTPAVSYWIRKLSLAGGINITASHNPIDYQGLKTYNHTGCQTSVEQEEVILSHIPPYSEIFKIEAPDLGSFSYLPDDYVDLYFSAVIDHLPKVAIKDKSTRFLFSSHHGTSNKLMKKLADRLGFNELEEYAPECTDVFELVGQESLNPEDSKSFLPAQAHAVKHGMDHILAHDPDSDRSALAERQRDGSWYYFNGNESAILMVDFLIQQNLLKKNQYFVSTHVSGNYINKICPRDTKFFLTKTGFKNIASIVEKHEAEGNLLIAYEEAIGALVFPINREKDGFQVSSLFMQMIALYKETGKTLLERMEEIYQQHGYWVGKTEYFTSTDVDWKDKFGKKMELCLKHPSSCLFGYQIEEVKFNSAADAVELNMKDGNWIKFRLSGTEPKFKIYYNLYGKSRDEINTNISNLREYFREYLGF